MTNLFHLVCLNYFFLGFDKRLPGPLMQAKQLSYKPAPIIKPDMRTVVQPQLTSSQTPYDKLREKWKWNYAKRRKGNICSFCGLESANRDLHNRHISVHNSPNPFQCYIDGCNNIYQTREGIVNTLLYITLLTHSSVTLMAVTIYTRPEKVCTVQICKTLQFRETKIS